MVESIIITLEIMGIQGIMDHMVQEITIRLSLVLFPIMDQIMDISPTFLLNH